MFNPLFVLQPLWSGSFERRHSLWRRVYPRNVSLGNCILSNQLLKTNLSCNIPTDAALQFRVFSLENDPLFRLLQCLSVDLSPSVRRSFCRSSVHPFVYLCFLCCSICLIYFPFYSIFLSKFPIYFIRRVILFVSPACLFVAMAGGPFLVFLSTCLVISCYFCLPRSVFQFSTWSVLCCHGLKRLLHEDLVSLKR